MTNDFSERDFLKYLLFNLNKIFTKSLFSSLNLINSLCEKKIIINI